MAIAFLLENDTPRYTVSCTGAELIRPSALGFVLQDAPPLTNRFELVEALRASGDETWQPVWGTAAEVRNHFNELTVRLREQGEPQREVTLVFRAYDDGVAFRYLLPAQSNLSAVAILAEATEFGSPETTPRGGIPWITTATRAPIARRPSPPWPRSIRPSRCGPPGAFT